MIIDTWQANSHGDIARVSIQFVFGVAEIDISQWQWSHENDEWVPKRNLLHFILRARNLPKFVAALDRAVRLGREKGSIPAWAVEAEVTKGGAEKQEQRPGHAA